jgi:hypothetical protein
LESRPRSIDAIVARAQQVLAESVKEAYTAGRADAAGALKSRVLELFEELLGPAPASTANSTPDAPPHDSSPIHVSTEGAGGHEAQQGHDFHPESGSNDFQQPQHHDQGHHG